MKQKQKKSRELLPLAILLMLVSIIALIYKGGAFSYNNNIELINNFLQLAFWISFLISASINLLVNKNDKKQSKIKDFIYEVDLLKKSKIFFIVCAALYLGFIVIKLAFLNPS